MHDSEAVSQKQTAFDASRSRLDFPATLADSSSTTYMEPAASCFPGHYGGNGISPGIASFDCHWSWVLNLTAMPVPPVVPDGLAGKFRAVSASGASARIDLGDLES